MSGDREVRLCGTCRNQIHNLSAMTRAHAEALLSRPEGPPCVTFVRRRDGMIVTADRAGWWGRIGTWMGRAAAFVALGWAAAGCGDKQKSYPREVGMVGPNPPIVSPPSTAPTTTPVQPAIPPVPVHNG